MKNGKIKNKLPGKHFKKLLVFLSAAAFVGTSLGAGVQSVYSEEMTETQVTTELETTSVEAAQSVSQEKYPAFKSSVDLDSVTVSVDADEGVFPEDSWLSVEKVSKDDQKRIDAAVEKVREEDLKTAVSYTYDIKVFNKENEEIQPADDAKVRVSFSMAETDNSNLSAQIYHISDDMKAEAPEVMTKGDTAYVVTEGFSFYTVEFTYNELQYVLEGDTAVSLKKILDTLGLKGTATGVEVSNSSLFSVYDENGEWVVSANKPFTSKEWMKVTVDGVVYEITVTDYTGGIDNDSVLGTYNITQSGDVTNFASGMTIPSIYIDYSKLRGKPDRYNINTRGWTDYTATGQGTGEPFQISTLNGTSTSLNSNTHSRYTDTLRTRANGSNMFDWTSLYANGKGSYTYSYSVRYNDAASDAAGNKYDVIVKYDAISLYLQSGAASSNGQTNLTVFNNTNGPAVRATSTTGNYRYGLQTNVTVSVVDGGSAHNQETAVNGTFLYSVAGLDQGRESSFSGGGVSGYHNINSAGDYVTSDQTNVDFIFGDRTQVLSSSSGNYNFSESVTMPSGLSGNIYIPDKSGYAVFIDNNGRFVATPFTSGDDTNHHSFVYGFAALGSASGVTTTAYSSAFMNDTDTANPNEDRARDIYILQSGASHDMTSASGDNGSIWLWDTGLVGSGNALHNDQVPADAERVFNVPNGKSVTYKLVPDTGYTIDDLTVDGLSDLANLVPVDADNNGKAEYWTYTFPATDADPHSIKVTWTQDGVRKITTSSGPNGSIWLWDSGDMDVGNLVHDNTVPANETRVNSFLDNKNVVMKLVPNSLFTIDQITANVGSGSAAPVDADSDGETDYWTYTVPAGTNPASVHVTWKMAPITQCDDCSNKQSCENCYLAKAGAISGYTNVNDKSTTTPVAEVFRGGSSPSGAFTTAIGDSASKNYKLDDDKVTFADVLPHGNIYIDTSRLDWSNSNVDGQGNKLFDIDIKDTTNFKWVGDTSVVDASGDSPSIKLNHSNRASTPIVAYYGHLHSYLSYGTEKTDGTLGVYAPDNTPAIPSNVANGTYRGVRVINGTNTIEAGVGNAHPYLYKITYYGAAVLQDGSRANLVLTVRKVEFESTMTTSNPVYVGVQGANSLYMIGDYKDPITDEYYFTKGFTNPSGTSTGTIRNAVGDGLSIDLQVQDNNGVAIPGTLTYAAQDLDIASYESFWGRVPSENVGTSSTDGSDYWGGTHELYAYGEGMEVKSGALSYALLPQYENSATGNSYLTETTSNTGALPINMVIDNMNTYYSAGATKYESPIRVEKGSNGELRFVTSSAQSVRNAYGTFDYVKYSTGFQAQNNYERYGTTVTRPQNDQGWSGFRQEMDSSSAANYTAGYDAGFAINLDASGSSLRFTGSQHVGSGASLETKLFDTSFLTYIEQSHGTGGGIFVEDYDYMNNCDSVYREGLVTLPNDSSIASIVVPEDGYRFSAFTVTEKGGSPVRYTIEDDGIYDGTTKLADFGTKISGTNITVSKNSNGTYSVNMDDITNPLDIHVDFEADYYFQKIWEGGAADESIIPDKLYMKAVPYIAAHDSVEIEGKTYQISREQVAGGPVITKYTYESQSGSIESYTLNDNNSPYDLQMISAGNHPTAKYPQIKIGTAGNEITYVVMGNELYRTKPAATAGTIMIDDQYDPIPINVKLMRANLDTKDFIICKSDVGVKKDSANKFYITKETKNGNIIWKMYYPSEGATGLSDGNWPVLPIEIEDSVTGVNNTDPDASGGHHVTTDHVERVYWFATEDINKLTEKWLLKNYVNEYSNDQVEVAGIASYKDGNKLAYKDKTYWYTQSTKDHDDVGDYMDKMANIQLEYMSPISDKITKNDGSKSNYSGWGGKVTNRIVETKLRVYKQWLNDESKKLLRTDIKMTVKRVYKYSQTDTVPDGKVGFVMPTGQVMNNIMKTIAGGESNIEAFKRGVEPLLEKKTAAKTTGYGVGDYVKIADVGGTDSEMYVWYDNVEKCIYYWTNADAVDGTDSWYIYLNEDASYMFKDFNKLKDIPGLDNINTSKTTNMTGMFELTNSGGELTGLNYMRKWDTSKVTRFTNMFKNQSKLENINGVIDWNVSGAGINENYYAGIFAGTKAESGMLVLKGEVPFIYYPHLQINASGNLEFMADDTSMASDVACNLIYDYDGNPGNNSGSLKDTNTNKWTWDMGDLLTASDVTKWEYMVFEDRLSNHTNLDGAVEDGNAVSMVRNPDTGYYEYTLTNELLENEITVDKKVTGSMGAKDKYFKFKIEIRDGIPGTVLNLDTAGMTISGFGPDASTPNSATTYTNAVIKAANTRDDDMDDTTRTYLGDKTVGRNVLLSYWKYGNDVYEYSLDAGKWKKNDTVVDTAPPDAATYVGKSGQQVILDGEGKATVYVYLNDNRSDGQKLVIKNIPRGTSYTITEEDAIDYETVIYDGRSEPREVVEDSGKIASGEIGKDFKESANGRYYKLSSSDRYERPEEYYADYNGSNLNSLPIYKFNADKGVYEQVTEGGTHYKVIDNTIDGTDASGGDFKDGYAYVTTAPGDRYDTTKTYTANIVRSYENNLDVIVPTGSESFPWYWVAVTGALIGGVFIFLVKRRKDKEQSA